MRSRSGHEADGASRSVAVVDWGCKVPPYGGGAFIKGSGFEALATPLWAMVGFAIVIFGAAVIATRRRIAE